jgi:WD40 repeat protein/adenylate kinase family enzyme
MQNFTVRKKLLITYLRAEENLKEELEKHLEDLPLQRLGAYAIDFISEHEEALINDLNAADIILELNSSSYSSVFEEQASVDITRAWERVLLRSQEYQSVVVEIRVHALVSPLKGRIILPTNEEPIVKWFNREIAFKNVIDELHKIIQKSGAHDKRPFPKIFAAPEQMRSLHESWSLLVPRSEEAEKTVNNFTEHINKGSKPLAVLWGACGSGKTTLALDVCDKLKRMRIAVGPMFWLNVGYGIDSVIAQVKHLYENDGGEALEAISSQDAISRFVERVKYRNCLIVIDDLCETENLYPLLHNIREYCALLVTTQNRKLLPSSFQDGAIIEVGRMNRYESISLLKAELKHKEGELSLVADVLADLANKLENWPLLLRQAGRYLADGVEIGRPINEEIESLCNSIVSNGLSELDGNGAISEVLDFSLKRLKAVEASCCQDLVVFGRGEKIPRKTIEQFWSYSHKTQINNYRDIFLSLYKSALISRLDKISPYLHLKEVECTHLFEVIHSHLFWRQRQNNTLPALHQSFINAHPSARDWSLLPEEEPYLWRYLAFHLVEADSVPDLIKTIKKWRYLVTKTRLLGPGAVMDDLKLAEIYAPDDGSLQKLYDGFREVQRLFDNHKNRMDENDIKIVLFTRLQCLRKNLQLNWEDFERNLDLPYVSQLKSEDKYGEVSYFSYDSNHRRLAFIADRVLRILDLQTMELVNLPVALWDKVECCAFNSDGTCIVASSDRTLVLWNFTSEQLLQFEDVHLGPLKSCSFSPNGKLVVSASSDKTLNVWNAITGHLLRTLKRDSDLFIEKDEKGNDLLDFDGKPIIREGKVRIDGHLAELNDCAFSSDGELIISASDDGTLKVWRMADGSLLTTLQTENAPADLKQTNGPQAIKSCAFSHDNKLIAAGAADGTITIWNNQGHSWESKGTVKLRRLEDIRLPGKRRKGHSLTVNECIFSLDSKLLISASEDGTLKVWKLFNDTETSEDRLLTTFYDDRDLNCCAANGDDIIAGGVNGIQFLKLITEIEKHDEIVPDLISQEINPTELPTFTPSTFLSHNSVDKELVIAVAKELEKLGVSVWLDTENLPTGTLLDKALPKAVQEQATMTVFLSFAAADSPWVRSELEAAFQKEKETGIAGLILPVFLNDPNIVIKINDLLREHWWDSSKGRPKIVYIDEANSEGDPDRAIRIAKKIAKDIRRLPYPTTT